MEDVFIAELRRKLQDFNPHRMGSNPLLGYQRSSAKEARNLKPPPKESAVMFLLFKRQGEWQTLFIQRPDGQGVHSNQLSFPGGKKEFGESAVDAALRETFEEVGIESPNIEILGQLTELFIPPSNFIVQPFIGIIHSDPMFTPNEAEVFGLIEYPVSLFLKDEIILEKEIYIKHFDKTIRARYFDVNGHTLWGATAMMIQEFREMWGFLD